MTLRRAARNRRTARFQDSFPGAGSPTAVTSEHNPGLSMILSPIRRSNIGWVAVAPFTICSIHAPHEGLNA
jgi:hypothetical protein